MALRVSAHRRMYNRGRVQNRCKLQFRKIADPSIVFIVCAIFIPIFATSRRGRSTCPCRRIVTELSVVFCFLGGCLLRHVLTRVDPIRVDINGGRQVVDACLEPLAAYFAMKVANAGFLIEFYLDGLFVVAEEAGEVDRKRFSLRVVSTRGEYKL